MCDDPEDDPDDDAIDPPMIFNFTDLFAFSCPRCGDTGCRHCQLERDIAETFGIPTRQEPTENDEYGTRLDRGFALLAEGDDSLLDD